MDGVLINAFRKNELGLTLRELAERTRICNRKPVSYSTISVIEQGNLTHMSRFNAARIAHGLGVELDTILIKDTQQEV